MLGSVIHVQFPSESPCPARSLKAPPSPPYLIIARDHLSCQVLWLDRKLCAEVSHVRLNVTGHSTEQPSDTLMTDDA